MKQRRRPSPSPSPPLLLRTCRTPRIDAHPSTGGAPYLLPFGRGRSFRSAWVSPPRRGDAPDARGVRRMRAPIEAIPDDLLSTCYLGRLRIAECRFPAKHL